MTPTRNLTKILAGQDKALSDSIDSDWLNNRITVVIENIDRQVEFPDGFGADDDRVTITLQSRGGQLVVRTAAAKVRLRPNDSVHLQKIAGRWEFQSRLNYADSVDVDAVVRAGIDSALAERQVMGRPEIERLVAERIRAAGNLRIPYGPTGARPAAPEIGALRFNTELRNFEFWNGEGWLTFAVEPARIPAAFRAVMAGRELPAGMSPVGFADLETPPETLPQNFGGIPAPPGGTSAGPESPSRTLPPGMSPAQGIPGQGAQVPGDLGSIPDPAPTASPSPPPSRRLPAGVQPERTITPDPVPTPPDGTPPVQNPQPPLPPGMTGPSVI